MIYSVFYLEESGTSLEKNQRKSDGGGRRQVGHVPPSLQQSRFPTRIKEGEDRKGGVIYEGAT